MDNGREIQGFWMKRSAKTMMIRQKTATPKMVPYESVSILI
jgi:hypothetical protein